MSKKTVARTWWSERFQKALDPFGWSTRLQRGHSYARGGRVEDLTIASGRVTARVRGSRLRPYVVTLRFATLPSAAWKQIVDQLAAHPMFMAELLAGVMPETVEETFAAAGHSLFPTNARDLRMDCSCPDWATPCKHAAAVYYMLGQAFDGDPFLLFRLRGMERDDLLARLRAQWTDITPKPTDQDIPWQAKDTLAIPPVSDATAAAPLSVDDAVHMLWETAQSGAYWDLQEPLMALPQPQPSIPAHGPALWGAPPFLNTLSPTATRELAHLLQAILESASVHASELKP